MMEMLGEEVLMMEMLESAVTKRRYSRLNINVFWSDYLLLVYDLLPIKTLVKVPTFFGK